MGEETPNRAVFFDRDGTLIEDVPYLCDPALVKARPEGIEWVRAARERGYLVVVASNQSGVGRGYYTEEDVARVNARVGEIYTEAGAPLDGFYYCPHAPSADDPDCHLRTAAAWPTPPAPRTPAAA